MHEWKSKVRDYEVDGYGGVNAAKYLNYMEEARKELLALLNFDLADLARRNIGFIVAEYNIKYHLTLVSGDNFVVKSDLIRISRLKVMFRQFIYREHDMKLAVTSRNIGVPINIEKNRPEWPAELNELLSDFPITPQKN